MNYKEFCAVENITHRALLAAKTFADTKTQKLLHEADHVLAQCRHAAMTLCDPASTPDAVREAEARLCEMFTKDEL